MSKNDGLPERRYEQLYGDERRELIVEKSLAWVPLGILEKHGEHLPWGLDAMKAHAVCMHLAERIGGVVLPANHLAGVHEPWVADPEKNLQWQAAVGNFYLRAETFRMLLEDIVRGLTTVGYRLIVLYSGHYPSLQRQIVQEVVAWATRSDLSPVIGFDEYSFFGEGEHAGKWETSLYLALGGEVRSKAIRDDQADVVGFWPSNSPPTEASATFGQIALERMNEHFRHCISEVLR